MSIFPTKILLATDGSNDAKLAAKAAADLSKRTGAQLHVVHAWRPLAHYAYPSFTSEKYKPPYEESARELLSEQTRRIEEAGGVVARAHLVMGRPTDVIVDLDEEIRANLIVMSSRGLEPASRLLIGSVSEGVVRHARCPVLVVRGGEGAWPPKWVVVGDDGSKSAKRAGELAAGIANLFGAETILVSARENRPEPEGGWSTQGRAEVRQTPSREQALKRRAKELEAIAGSRPYTRLIDTDATLAMLLVAEEKEKQQTLLAVGSRGVGVAKRAMLGSVSTNVLRAARGPVLIWPPCGS